MSFSLGNIVKNNLCISCGVCEYLSNGGFSLRYSGSKGMYIPKQIRTLSNHEISQIMEVCPAMGYPIVSLGKKINADKYDYRIGYYATFMAAKSTSEAILRKSSSGGIMTALSSYLLNNKIVDGVIVTKYIYGEHGEIFPQSFIARTEDELIESQGSKYMPVPIFKIFNDVRSFDGTLGMVGTPCEIAALRYLQKQDETFNKIKFVIGNFCGGFRDLRELNKFKKIADVGNDKIKHFQYRGDGQPGRMVIVTDTGKSWSYPYPDYAKLTGYPKYYRCRVCIDATAELADVSCGDAWLPKFRDDLGGAWSMVIVRNNKFNDVIKEMQKLQLLKTENVSLEELLKSQKQNITSKKERFLARKRFLRVINHIVPQYDGGYNESDSGSLSFEAKVWYSQKYKLWLEKLGIYQRLFHKK